MATLKQIQFKRSKIAGARPAASVLAEGELAINLKDRTIFTKDDSGNIIDLSISAGGNISGNITQTGDYTQTGKFNLIGPQIVASGGYIEFNYRTTGSGAWSGQHTAKAPIFVDLSSATSTSEYNPIIKQRFKDGTFSLGTLVSEGSLKIHYINESGDSKYWTFRRDGGFTVDGGGLGVSGGSITTSGNIAALGNITSPQINTKNIILDTKAFGQYDSQSLVQYVYPGTGEENGINYLRKVRAKSGGTIYHEIASAQTGKNDEISWWTGNTLTTKLMGLRNDGAMVLRRSLAIGTITTDENTNNYGSPTPMGERYIALGDAATGLKYIKQGVYDLVGNWNSVASITPDSFRSTRKALFGRSEDQGGTWTMPGTNAAFLSVQTQADENTAGDGQTHIGYNSGGKMNHYFRGKGKTNINTQEGMEVNPGILKLVTGSNNVMFYADGGITSVKQLSIYNGIYLAANNSTAGLTFAPTTTIDGTKQILWEGGTRAGQNKSYVTVKAWGNSFNASGDRNRETVFEVADGQGYYFYSQRVAPSGSETTGPVVTQFNGQVNARGSIITDGSFKVNGLSTLVGNVTMSNGLFVQGGSSITGQVKIGGTADALRIWNAEYGAIFRRSESNLYIIPTPKDAGESGGISNLRPLIIELNTGTVKMSHDVHLGDSGSGTGLLQVSNSLKTIKMICPVTINSPNAVLTLDSPSSSANYLLGSRDGTRSWYVGLGGAGNDLSLYSQYNGHGLVISNNLVSITKPLKVGNAQLGTDGNITNGSGNFANLNTTLNRKVNSGFITYGATSGWYKFATVTMPQSTSTVFFKIVGGSGFNSGLFTQCNIAEIVLRTGNERPSDLNAVLYTRTTGMYSAAFRNIAVNNVSGNTYDIYVYAGTYCNQLVCEWSCTENATVSVIGINSSTQSPVDALPDTAVDGQVANVLNNLVDRGKVKRYEADSEIAINSPTGIRIRSNGDKTGSVATMLRNDGGSFYILFTDKNATDGAATVNGDWNSKRPFAINLTTGEVMMNNGIAVRSAALFYNSINVKDNGSINFDKSGANPRNMRIFHAGDASRGNRIEIADETNYIAYFEKAPGGANRFVVNNATVAGVNQMNSFGININNALGGNSIAFGDSDTGIKQNGDGLLDIYANSVQVFRFQNGDLYSYKNINAPNVYIRSDIRLKSNFKPIENALDKVEKLNGVIYDKAEYIGGEAIETEAGIVAQTLQDVLPEAVRETEDSKGNKILTVSSQAQIALLVEAVKTLSSRVKELESKLM
ncbi:long tail fiber protein distal subunit [Enterobacteria phage RB18]|uniref:Long tail fiber protein Gp37 n=1 Tax=Enterobacteria phage RB18 TaxID=10692 RepID=A0A345AZM7_BPR18|nr:long tail fiber protein distal subunit [Enterobacteria phage RB18]AXF42557.1 large distal tail fiber subunit [Enterobacteria phage RB18]